MSQEPSSQDEKPSLPSAETAGKWLAIAISLIGIYAWAAGQAYDIGYWQVLGWDGSIAKPAVQEMAFNGLVGPFFNWFWATSFLLLMGILGLSTEFVSSRRRRPTPSHDNENRPQKKMDAFTVIFFGGAIASAILLACAVLIPLALWVASGMRAGRMSATDDVCIARTQASFPTKLILGDGTSITGRFLARSEKLSVVIDQKNVYVVTVGEKPHVIDMTDLSRVICSAATKKR